MDARPQRPLRSMRTFNDENIVPTGPLPKTIHQRNKSSPALANLNAGTALKAAAKRTAFGDVSNIANVSRLGKQEALHPSKPVSYSTSDVALAIAEKKTAPLLRPAQRPLSVSHLKSLLTGSGNNGNSSEVQTKAPVIEAPTSQYFANTRKVLTKKATLIFKDGPLESVQEDEAIDPLKKKVLTAPPALEISLPDIALVEPDSNLSLRPPQTLPTPEPVKVAKHTENALPPAPKSEVAFVHTALPSEIVHLQSAKPAIDEPKFSIPDLLPSYIPDLAQALLLPNIETPLLLTEPEIEAKPRAPPHQTLPEQAHTAEPAELMQIPRRPEPEEYWEEDEEDAYEEDAYVTARSFRSKGDNTTGGVTTVVVPRVSQKARKEIEAATKLVEATRTYEEIEDEAYDTSMVAQYGDEIFEYMRQLEVKMSPNPHYMDNQHEIQWSMRSVLMDWLVQVHHRFNLLPETLFLCVNYIDRFLSCKVVSLGKLQLVGATAIFIAAKYEEINCPSVQEIVYMVDGGYSIDEILKAERFMLTMLQFELGWPGPMSFLRRISKADDYDLETRTLAKYFLEVTLMDERFIGSPPSFAAAASHCLARMMLRKGSWTAHHIYYSGYTYSQLKPLVQLLLDCCNEPRKHHSAVYNKYCDKRYKRASAFVENELARGFMLPQSPLVNNPLQSSIHGYCSSNQYFGL